MNIIWQINPSYYKNINNFLNFSDSIYFCSYCCKYVESEKFKKLLISNPNPKFITENNYTKCFFCNRFIKGILTGPDIIKFIDSNISTYNYENNFYLLLTKITTWYYHDIYNDFGYLIKKKYNFNSAQIKNIYKYINVLYGLPSKLIINEKANDIVNLCNY
jgi:hypothetical protein